MNTGAVSVKLQDWTERRIEFCVHQHHMLAMTDGIGGNPGAKLNGAGRLDNHINVGSLTQKGGIFHNGRLTLADTVFQLSR